MNNEFNFFENPNYDLLEKFQTNNVQTEVTDETLSKIVNLDNKDKSIQTLFQVYKEIHENMKEGSAKKFERSSQEIIDSGVISGCNDYGLVSTSVLRRLGYPTVFVQTARIDWIEDFLDRKQNCLSIKGHIFLEVYVENKWILFDPTKGFICLEYDINNFSLPNNYYTFSKSADGWETGCVNLHENNIIIFDLFKSFDLTKYQNPNYIKVFSKDYEIS
jgi:hypothetical protein